MSIPTLATTDDVEALVEYLRTKPLGAKLTEAKATLPSKLLDSKRVNAYQHWGFISSTNDKLELTTMGRDFAQASTERRQEIFAKILRQEPIYYTTLELMYHRNIGQIPLEDVASHWVTHFSSEVATGSERALKEQVTCFMSIASAAGLGDYLIGRRGSNTRFEVNRDALEEFMLQVQAKDLEDDSLSQDEGSSTDAEEATYDNHIPQTPRLTQQSSIYSTSPSLHIDIQIHIDSDATPEQIDQIFASMAKHLYDKDNN